MTTTLDPTLDQDVADWFAASCDRPRLSLLGPVNVRAHGTEPARRKARYNELLAFLALRGGRGVDVDEICLALGVGPTKLRQDISTLRTWLGTDPRTGEPHLPTLGPHGYRAGDRLMVDLDLFRRLRLRGEARGGAEGLSDMARALELVSGRPFDQQRPGGWSWLSSGERIDVYMPVAIADVALTVTNGCLERGDTDRARAAADIAALAAPDEEVTRLCRVRVDEAVPGGIGEREDHVETLATRCAGRQRRAAKTVTLERRDGWYLLVLAVCLACCGYLVVRGTGAIAEGPALPADLAQRLELVTKAGWLTIIFSAFVGFAAAALLIGDEHADDR